MLHLFGIWKSFFFVRGVMADKFTVVSFLEALEDSVAKAGSSSAGDKDAEPKRGGGNDPMDESW